MPLVGRVRRGRRDTASQFHTGRFGMTAGAPMADHSLAAHTPSFDFVFQATQRRIMQLLGANKEFIDTVAPLPYKSPYPYSNKLLDALDHGPARSDGQAAVSPRRAPSTSCRS